MPDTSSPSRRRTTLIGKKIRENLNKPVKVFLENGIALNGVLLDYFYDPIEKDGCLTLGNSTAGADPSFVFRSFVTTIQPTRRKTP